MEVEEGGLDLTILMPCRNEAAAVAVCVKEARGFLVREKNEEARRKASVVLTDKGKSAASSQERPAAADGGDPRFAALTAAEQETLRGLLRKLLAKK